MLSIRAPDARNDSSGSRDRVFRRAFAWSVLIHAIALAIASVVGDSHNLGRIDISTQAPDERSVADHIVFLAPTEHAPGGGGGGGNRQPGPIRRAESVGHDQITLRIRKPIEPSDHLVDEERPTPALVLDAKPLMSGAAEQLGLPEGGAPVGTSTGPGSGGGVGSGVGTGIGSGRGPGLGPGSGGGAGGGVYRGGGAVTPPKLH